MGNGRASRASNHSSVASTNEYIAHYPMGMQTIVMRLYIGCKRQDDVLEAFSVDLDRNVHVPFTCRERPTRRERGRTAGNEATSLGPSCQVAAQLQTRSPIHVGT